jgi:hypothetical protein
VDGGGAPVDGGATIGQPSAPVPGTVGQLSKTRATPSASASPSTSRRSAAPAFARPLVTERPDSPGLASTVPMMRSFSSWVVRDGVAASSSAASPETWGAAIDVPSWER